MAQGFFITGTDTGVGKTIIAAALVRVARHLGFSAVGMKPIETGCTKAGSSRQHAGHRDNTLIPQDGKLLRKISGTDESLDLIAPVRFEHPLAPMPASEMEGISVDIAKIRDAFSTLVSRYSVVIIEGIGGILVPITKDYSVLDLAKDFSLPVIVVARPGLGTINHTLLTVRCALKERIPVAGVIVNYSLPAERTLAEQTNPQVLAQICPVPVVGIFPHMKNITGKSITEAALQHLDLHKIKQYLH